MSSYVLATYFSQKLCIYNYRSTSDIFLYICTLIQLAAAARLSVQVNKLYIFVRSLGYCPLKQFIAIFMNYFQGGYYVDNIKSNCLNKHSFFQKDVFCNKSWVLLRISYLFQFKSLRFLLCILVILVLEPYCKDCQSLHKPVSKIILAGINTNYLAQLRGAQLCLSLT